MIPRARSIWVPLILILLTTLSAKAWGQTADQLYYEAKREYYRLLSLPGKQADRENWLRVVERYERVLKSSPDSPRNDEILNTIAAIYLDTYRDFKQGPDLEAAIKSYTDLYAKFPQSRYAEKSYLMVGDLLFKLKRDYEGARRNYLALLERFPEGEFRGEAERRINDLSRFQKRSNDREEASNEGNKLVRGLRHWSNPSYTRVAIDVEDKVAFDQHILRDPDRLYLDLHQTYLKPGTIQDSIPIDDGLLKKVRMAQNTNDRVRVVLDIDNITRFKVFSLDNPFRIIIDVKGDDVKESRKKEVDSARPESPVRDERPVPDVTEGGPTIAQQLGLDIKTIVIDPGHGGKDPGAIGPSGIMEKEIVLSIAKRLKAIIEQDSGKRVILTRDKDVFIPLEERTAIANANEADLFISIHVNSSPRRSLKGIETYYLNLASSEDAKLTAARENQTSLKKVSDLQKILEDLLLTSKLQESSQLADIVQKGLISGLSKGYADIKNLGVKQAPFYVLIGAQMPSVLVELSFISNPQEEKRLMEDRFREEAAQHLYNGIKGYMDTFRLAYSTE